MIADAVAAVPRVDVPAFERIFNDSLQDMLMVVYLANLTRAQISVAEKITTCL